MSKLTWKNRLAAWWDGTSPPVEVATSTKSEPAPRRKRERTLPVPQGVSDQWTLARFDAVEHLWSDGFTQPGKGEYIETLTQPLALSAGKRLLQLGSQLGGPAREIIGLTGAHVDSFDPDELLASAASVRDVTVGSDELSTVRELDTRRPEFDASYDALFAKETLYAIQHREDLLKAAIAALQPGAPIVITDYMLAHSGKAHGDVDKWISGEPKKPFPWTLGNTVDVLRSQRVEVKVTEDISSQHVGLILNGWNRLTADFPEAKRNDADFKQCLISEGEMWARRIAALKTNDLKVYRIQGFASSA